ncbi:MAG: divalent-cation tolerance protein CutA [Euryarchaeota archaeon]|nr:divalent-cation tolerance protein CutA [Euryarchaeota archaeon]MDE1835834.1 divalent-cation tolerance protein CutA [Euryarchaeota archaeon]MDE1880515.1 divalent-cation tolerance protein CutA [Euryarchaeota archaeon]MDE2045808.1 divalent-cation tolerance protein CutA [Thermoplasmata archaeon]
MTSSPSLGEGPRAGPLRLVLSTFPDGKSAAEASLRLVERKVVACATALPARSLYRWKGKVEESQEVLVLFKTSTKKVGALFRELARIHPYEVPEIVELETFRVHEPYLRWLLGNVDRASRDVARASEEAAVRPSGRPRTRSRRSARSAPSRPS